MARSFIAGLALCLCSAAAWSQQYTITTIAGTSIPGSSTSGFADGPATTAAQLDFPGSLWVTSKGDVYIADGLNQRARLLSGGNVTTIAGNGYPGFAGDNGPANSTSVELNDPLGIAVDSSGNVYIADTANNVVRKVANGTITTFAGNNGYGAGDSGDHGPATNASLNAPVGLAFDSSGNLYICDANNEVVREVLTSANPPTIITVVGTTSITASTLKHPVGIAVDTSGNIYIADSGISKIYKFTVGTGKITTVAGSGTFGFSGDGGPAIFANLGDPQGVAVDALGNIYIADTVNNRIRKVTTDGIISTIAGTGRPTYTGDGGPATQATLYGPGGLFVDASGNIYVADTHNSVIRLLQPTGYPTVNQGGVTNAASYQATISPGALATVFGTLFGTSTGQPLGNPLPINYGGVGVTVNGTPANLYYVSPGQINFQVPWETAVGTANVAVTLSGGASNTVSVPVVSAGPGLFTINGAAIVQNAPSYSLNTQANPAPAGSTIVAYLTGSGPVSPAMTDGVPTPNSLVQATLPWAASIGSSQAQVSFIGLTPGFVGLVQANIVVPPALATGTYPLVVSIGGQASNAGNVYVK